MSTLKERFENYTVTPDEKVWEGISKELNHKHVARRRTVAAASAAAVVTVAVVAVLMLRNVSAPAVPNADRQTASAQLDGQQIPENVPAIAAADGNASPAASAGQTLPAGNTAAADNTPQEFSLPTVPAADAPQLPNDMNNSLLPSAPAPSPVPATATPVSKHSTAASTAANDKAPVAADNGTAPSSPQTVDAKSPQAHSVTKPDELVVWIPNAFSPDDPSADDRIRKFRVYPNGGSDIISFEIFIYSRAGRLVYHSKNVEEAWDGTANGHAQPMGTYVYIIEIKDSVKGIQHTRGTVTLVR